MAFRRRLRRTLLVAAAVAVLLVFATVPAWADEAAAIPPSPSPPAPRAWYGGEILLADGVSIVGLPIAAGVARSEALLFVALGGYLFAPPTTHFAHGRIGAGFGSFGLRVGVPVGGALLGAALGSAGDNGGGEYIHAGAAVGFVLGGGLGVLGAVALDASLLSYETKDENPPRSALRSPKAFAVTPTIGPRKEGGIDLGIGGMF